MQKYRSLLVSLLVFSIIGIALFFAAVLTDWTGETSDGYKGGKAPLPEDNGGGAACIQVITPARNIETGEVRDFPTPCDVPQGWEQI